LVVEQIDSVIIGGGESSTESFLMSDEDAIDMYLICGLSDWVLFGGHLHRDGLLTDVGVSLALMECQGKVSAVGSR
jgi:hypothetical protein